MADPRWTDETTALVERIVARATNFDIDCAGPGEAKAATEEHAFAVLDALADAGLLLTAGETREEWGVRIWADGEEGAARTDRDHQRASRADAVGVVDTHAARRAANPPAEDTAARRWFGNASLLRRTVLTTPWVEVPTDA